MSTAKRAPFGHRHSMKIPPPDKSRKLFSAGVPTNPGGWAFVLGFVYAGRVKVDGGGEYMGAKYWWDLPEIPA
jgi:hypothetical protein